MTKVENVQEVGVYSDVKEHDVGGMMGEDKQILQDNNSNTFSNNDLLQKVLETESGFNTLNSRVDEINNVVIEISKGLGGVINHVNGMTQQFNETVTAMKQISDMIKNNGGVVGNTKQNVPAPITNNKDMNAEAITAMMQQQTSQPQGIASGLLSNSGGVAGILDRILQFYLATKDHQTVDPSVAFMNNLQTSVDLLRSMSGLVSSLKNDWIKEEKLVHQIEKGNVSKPVDRKKKKESDL